MLALFMACSDDNDKDNGLPIVGLEFPKFENPVKPGESITIKGEDFTKVSEIWFRTIVIRAENTGDVKAIVTEVNSSFCMIRTGRIPPCSDPTTGLKSA